MRTCSHGHPHLNPTRPGFTWAHEQLAAGGVHRVLVAGAGSGHQVILLL